MNVTMSMWSNSPDLIKLIHMIKHPAYIVLGHVHREIHHSLIHRLQFEVTQESVEETYT